ncbi:hypothetical protein SMICM304S_10517 [Streptomyces microflavus]
MEIASNFWDEMGNGDHAQVHTTLFNKIFEVFEIPDEELERSLTAEIPAGGDGCVRPALRPGRPHPGGRPMTAAAGTAGEYPMQRWVFEDAAGRYDIDLGTATCSRTDGSTTSPSTPVWSWTTDTTGASARCATGSRPLRRRSRLRTITQGAQQALYLVYATLPPPVRR